jgi:hypothetical protein
MRETLAKLPDAFRMTVTIYRPDYDCTNNGLSSQHDRITIVGAGYQPGSARADAPAFFLRELGGAINLYPADVGRPGEYMFGGNFAFCSDSRFPNQYPIPVHDRRE